MQGESSCPPRSPCNLVFTAPVDGLPVAAPPSDHPLRHHHHHYSSTLSAGSADHGPATLITAVSTSDYVVLMNSVTDDQKQMNRRLPFLLARPRRQQGSSVHATSAPHFPHPHPHPGWLAHPCPRLPSMQCHCLPEYVSQPKLDPGSATRAAMSTPPDLQLPTGTVYCRQTRDRPPEGSRQQCRPPGTVVGL